jgi:hypothetical protein
LRSAVDACRRLAAIVAIAAGAMFVLPVSRLLARRGATAGR